MVVEADEVVPVTRLVVAVDGAGSRKPARAGIVYMVSLLLLVDDVVLGIKLSPFHVRGWRRAMFASGYNESDHEVCGFDATAMESP